MTSLLADPTYSGDLGHGLIRRWSTRADQVKISHLMGSVFVNSPSDPFNIRAADEARIFMSDGFPYMGPGDIALVEDTSKPERPVVACVCCWQHQWSYGGIPFGVGRPENIATDPAYRNRGLVRALMEMFHARSATQGHLVQAITGIRYFYRQFGYEYVLDLGGSCVVTVTAIPNKTGDEPEPYTLRPATLADLPHLPALYDQARPNSLVWHEAGEAYWRYHITGWELPGARGQTALQLGFHGHLHMIIDSAGQVCGYTWLADKRWGNDLEVYALELAPQVNWQRALPALLRALRQHGTEIPAISPDTESFSEIWFGLWRAHPLYEVLGERLTARVEPPYAWYLRVPDLPAFVRHIAPVLEARLTQSLLVGYSGELKLSFYRGGLCLRFAQGKLLAAEPWQAADADEANGGCPPLLFLQLLFGYRSLAELRAIFPDAWAKAEAALLVNTLFPKQPSTVYSLSYT
jgi:GNAT superfamily N-acetyltransferase